MTSTTSIGDPLPPRAAARAGWTSVRRWQPWVLALVFAAVLTSLPIDAFKDRQNYLNYFPGAVILLFTRFEDGVLSLLTNEPVYLSLCLLLNSLFEPETGLRIVIFSGAFLVAFNALRMAPDHVLLVLCILLAPQVLKNHVVHLRQGLGIGVFLLGWASRRPWPRWTFMLLAPLIHSSFVFVLFLMAVGAVLRKLGSHKLLVVVTYLALGLAIGLLLGVVAQRLGARQGDEFVFSVGASTSGLGFVFWLLPLVIMLLQPPSFVRQHLLEMGSLIVYLATYFLSPVTGRVFESSLILILMAGLRMRRNSRLAFLALVGAYAVLQWLQIAYGTNTIFSPEDL